MIHPDLFQEIARLSDLLRAKFSPPEFIPGCQVKSVADVSLYATNNGWIEAICGQHNQQRVRWKSNETVAVNDYIDVLYFPDRRLFEAYGLGGTAAIAAASGGGGWPNAGKAMINSTEYATIPDAVTAASAGDIIKVGQGTFTLADTLTLNKNVTLKGLSAQDTIITQSVGLRTLLLNTAGATVEDLTVINTRTTGTVYGITASANCRISRVITTSTGAATDGNGINVSGATVDLIDVEATASGATSNYGLYVQNSGVANVYRGVYGAATADIYVDTATVDLFDPVLTNSVITAVSATIQGWYFDASGHHTAYALSRLLWTRPAFSVNKAGTDQTGIVTATWTKLTWSTEVFDTHGWFASDKYTPLLAGKYFFNAKVYWNASLVDQSNIYASLYKNGVEVSEFLTTASGTGAQQIQVTVSAEANGSTDYFEIYVHHTTGANEIVNGNVLITGWSGFYLGR